MVHRNSGKRDGRIIYSLPKVQPLFQVIKKQAVEKDGQRQTQQGADQVVPKLDAGYGEGVVQRGRGLEEDACEHDAAYRVRIQMA